MKIITSILAFVLILLSVVFAVNNRTEVSLDLWPAAYTLSAPVYFITLVSFFIGFLLGAIIFWLLSLHPRWQRHRLARETDHLKAALMQERAKNTTALPRHDG
jgi:uncharacterized integral membrane protein